MKYFLAKTDPDTYSIDHLEAEKRTIWDGVHNFQAINVIKKMQPGDLVYLYHSQTDKAIVGLMKVVGTPYQNPHDPRVSWAVEMELVKRYDKPVTLAEIKANETLHHFALVRNSRLSTMEVPEDVQEWLAKKFGD